jgi:membrane associated rhomboid family serine protease
MANCAFHPDRETFRSCSRCGQPACHDCLIDAPVGAQCRSCVRAAKPSTTQTLKANFRKPTLVTQVLLASFVAIYVFGALKTGSIGVGLGSGSSSLHEAFAVDGPDVANGEWWRLITGGFLHFGIIHLASNSWAMWNVGQALERDLGRWRFICLFVVAVLGGSAGAILFAPLSLTAGASGGLFGFFAAGFVGSRARGIPFGASVYGPTLLMNIFITYQFRRYISVGGHLGGAIAGAICGYVLMGRRSLIGTKASRDKQDIAVLVGVGLLAVVIALLAAYR